MPNHQDFFIDEKQRSKLFSLILRSIAETRNAIDIVFATPLRDWQVFDAGEFSRFLSGFSHNSVLSPITAAFSIVGAIPFIARLFVKSQVNNLGKVFNHLDRDFDIKIDIDDFDKKTKLEQRFNAMLEKKGFHHIRSEIVKKENGKSSLKFKYVDSIPLFFDQHWDAVKDLPRYEAIKYILKTQVKDPLQAIYGVDKSLHDKSNAAQQDKQDKDIRALKDIFNLDLANDAVNDRMRIQELLNIFKKNGERIADFIRDIQNSRLFNESQFSILLLISRIYTCFLNDQNQLDANMTLKKSRENFINKMNQISASQVAGHAYDLVNDYTYNFWIGYFCQDILDGRDDMSLWNYSDQVLVLAIAGGITLVQAGLRLAHYHINKKNADEVPITSKTNKYTNKSLKHQLLEKFMTEEIYEKNKKLVVNHQYSANLPSLNGNIVLILNEKFDDKFVLNPSPVAKQLDYLKHIYDSKRSKIKERFLTVISNGLDQAITISFIGWVIGAALGAAGAVAVSVAILSNPVTVGLAVMGLFFGVTWFADRQIQKDKQLEEEKSAQLAADTENINKLKTLEHQNEQLKALLITHHIKPLTVADPHDDRFFRRLTNQKTPVFTSIKKAANRFFVGVGKAGTGILIARLAILPLLAVTAATGPVGLGIALTLGVIWAVVNVIKYHHEHKIAKYQRLLDDIDNRILTAEQNQDIYLRQLGYKKEVVAEKNPINTNPINLIEPEFTKRKEFVPSSVPTDCLRSHIRNIVEFEKNKNKVDLPSKRESKYSII